MERCLAPLLPSEICRLSFVHSPAATDLGCVYLGYRKIPLGGGCRFCEWTTHTLSTEVQNKSTALSIYISRALKASSLLGNRES